MKYALVIWEKCPAGNNIKNALLRLYKFSKKGTFDNNPIYFFKNINLYTSKTKHIHCENIDKKLSEDIIIFLTQHKSISKLPSFCVHVTGNFGKAEFGGQDKQLSIAYPSLMKEILLELKKQNTLENFEVTGECVHHGPLLRKKPSLFVEIGSSEKEWKIKKAGEIIAKSIMNVLTKKIKKYKIAIGFGGGHYIPSFNKILEKTNIAVSCICPKYHLHNLNKNLVAQMINRSFEKVEFILLDWKGLGKEKNKIKDLLENFNLEIIRTNQIKNYLNK